jgi:hypothetical protein
MIIPAIIHSTHYYRDRKIPKTPQSGEPGHEIEISVVSPKWDRL